MESLYELSSTTRSEGCRSLFKKLLEAGSVSSLLVQMKSTSAVTRMPALVSDPKDIDAADPLTQSFPLNMAKLVSTLTKKGLHEPVGIVLRPCEHRAVIELIKIRQAQPDNLIFISADCAGAVSNRRMNDLKLSRTDEEIDLFLDEQFSMSPDAARGTNLTASCQACTGFVPQGVDIHLRIIGASEHGITIEPGSDRGASILAGLSLQVSDPDSRQNRVQAVNKLMTRQQEQRQAWLTGLDQSVSTPKGLSDYLSGCVDCHNCRVACPVCFCRECVFNTDVVEYEPFQYTGWSAARGSLRMPMDTLFFHMTRMIHMGLSCVGCGQCSNACPNDIPVAGLFLRAGSAAQKAFGYTPGRSLDDAPPLSLFNENEFLDVTGQ